MTYVSPDFIATSRLVPRDGLDRCELPLDLHLCDMVRFDPLTVIGDTLAFNFDAGPPALFAVFAFQPGAFGAPGVYDSTAGNFGDARLTVTRSAAPEPGQWTILITGLTLAGTALRRRRIGRPARWAPKVRV
jgi:hypothetical protein